MSYMCCDVWERNVRFLMNQRKKENNENASFMKRLVFGSCAWWILIFDCVCLSGGIASIVMHIICIFVCVVAVKKIMFVSVAIK